MGIFHYSAKNVYILLLNLTKKESGPFLPDLLQPDLSYPGPFVAGPFAAVPFAAGPFEDGRFVGVTVPVPVLWTQCGTMQDERVGAYVNLLGE
jgi:hypothetical protein